MNYSALTAFFFFFPLQLACSWNLSVCILNQKKRVSLLFLQCQSWNPHASIEQARLQLYAGVWAGVTSITSTATPLCFCSNLASSEHSWWGLALSPSHPHSAWKDVSGRQGCLLIAGELITGTSEVFLARGNVYWVDLWEYVKMKWILRTITEKKRVALFDRFASDVASEQFKWQKFFTIIYCVKTEKSRHRQLESCPTAGNFSQLFLVITWNLMSSELDIIFSSSALFKFSFWVTPALAHTEVILKSSFFTRRNSSFRAFQNADTIKTTYSAWFKKIKKTQTNKFFLDFPTKWQLCPKLTLKFLPEIMKNTPQNMNINQF